MSNLRPLVFNTTPSGARLTLRAKKDGSTYEGTTPFSRGLPPDVYTWEIEMPGYLTDQSRAHAIDLISNSRENISMPLTPAGNRESTLQRGNDAFAAGRCSDVIRIFDGVDRPGDPRSSAGIEWLETRLKTGQCQRRIHEYEKSISTFKQVLDVSAAQWGAKYELGLAMCEIRDFASGKANFRDMEGQFVGQVDAQRKQGIRLLARYGTALCKYQELGAKTAPERFTDLREETQGAFEEFIDAADKESRLPDDMKRTIAAALQDAKRKVTSIPGS